MRLALALMLALGLVSCATKPRVAERSHARESLGAETATETGRLDILPGPDGFTLSWLAGQRAVPRVRVLRVHEHAAQVAPAHDARIVGRDVLARGDHEIELALAGALHGGGAIGEGLDVVAVRRQRLAHDLEERSLVVDDTLGFVRGPRRLLVRTGGK